MYKYKCVYIYIYMEKHRHNFLSAGVWTFFCPLRSLSKCVHVRLQSLYSKVNSLTLILDLLDWYGLVPTVWVSRLQAVFGAVYWNILKYGFCCFFNIKILAFYRYIQSWWQIWQYLWPHFGWIYFHISHFGWIYYLSRYILDSLRWNYF